MRCNSYKDHLLILPEDDANRQIANGFQLHPCVNSDAMYILEEGRGWKNAVELFIKSHAKKMRKFSKRLFLLLIDFDRQADRLTSIQSGIPDDLRDRVFILGTESEPEVLRRDLKGSSLEDIGETLAGECAESRHELWHHSLLKHNQSELNRLRPLLRSFLFQNPR
jgi:hypothetical protein